MVSEVELAAVDSMFSVGAYWPPKSSESRLRNYAVNQLLYDGKHTRVFTKLNKIFQDGEAEHQKLILVYNFHQRLSTLWADLTFGETPIVKIVDVGKKKAFRRFAEQTNQLWQVFYQGVIDLSRFGDCVFRIWFDEKKGARLECVSPTKWFQVTNPFTSDVIAQVIAYEIDLGFIDHVQTTYVKVEIHTVGHIETRMYRLKEGKLSTQVDAGQLAEMGVVSSIDTLSDDILVIPVSRMTSSTDTIGQDDYKTLDSIIESIEMRYTRLARILDYHSEPDKGVPESAFEQDDSGREIFDNNRKVWPIIEGTPLPQYITWAEGGVMAAGFTHIDKLMERLYEVSETCKAAFAVDQVGGAISGTALKLLMTIPLKKSKRMGSLIFPVVPNVVRISTALEVARRFEGAVAIDDFQFTPQDGLPNDKTETIANMVSMKNIEAVTDERMQTEVFGLEGEELAAEVLKLKAQREAAKPPAPMLPKVDPNKSAESNVSKLGGKPDDQSKV